MREPAKPRNLFDEDAEWAELVSFMSPAIDSLRLGVVYGRRRQGKSEMLRQLCDAVGGFYSLALEQYAKTLARSDSPTAWPSEPVVPPGWGSPAGRTHSRPPYAWPPGGSPRYATLKDQRGTIERPVTW